MERAPVHQARLLPGRGAPPDRMPLASSPTLSRFGTDARSSIRASSASRTRRFAIQGDNAQTPEYRRAGLLALVSPISAAWVPFVFAIRDNASAAKALMSSRSDTSFTIPVSNGTARGSLRSPSAVIAACREAPSPVRRTNSISGRVKRLLPISPIACAIAQARFGTGSLITLRNCEMGTRARRLPRVPIAATLVSIGIAELDTVVRRSLASFAPSSLILA